MSHRIDDYATRGLFGTVDSLAYRVGEIERHLHNWEHWFELASAPDAEVHRADHAGTGAGVFQIDAGNLAYGAWVQVLGSGDTPHNPGYAKYDVHRILVTATERNSIYVMQLAFGASGDAAVTALAYSEIVFMPASAAVDSGPIDLITRRQAAGTKAWARCICPGQNTATLDFVLGLHEYEG